MEFRASCILGKCSTLFCIRKVLWLDHFLNILFIKSIAISTWTWERKNSKTEAGPPGLVSQTLLQLIAPFSFLIEPWLVSNVCIALLDSSYHILERSQAIRSKPWVITHDHIAFLFPRTGITQVQEPQSCSRRKRMKRKDFTKGITVKIYSEEERVVPPVDLSTWDTCSAGVCSLWVCSVVTYELNWWRRGSVSTGLAAHAWWPEFRSPEPAQNAAYNSRLAGRGGQPSSLLASQSNSLVSSQFRKRSCLNK